MEAIPYTRLRRMLKAQQSLESQSYMCNLYIDIRTCNKYKECVFVFVS